MSGMVVLYIFYTVVLLAGGVLGFAKTKSAPSLIAGVVSAGLMDVAAVLLHLHHPRSGLGLGAVLSLAMAVFFFSRYRRTGKAMPAVPVVVFSAVVFLATLGLWVTAARHHA